MNFADAIRQASKHLAHSTPEPFPLREATYAAAEPTAIPFVPAEPANDAEAAAPAKPKAAAKASAPKPEQGTNEMESNPEFVYEAPSVPSNATVIRLEMFLTAEQISALFRSVATSQHSVLTLREAANHLRVSAHTLEDLASSGEVPAFLVDGKWRFPKAGLDEWVALQIARKEAS